jgi:hypothetical protein
MCKRRKALVHRKSVQKGIGGGCSEFAPLARTDEGIEESSTDRGV